VDRDITCHPSAHTSVPRDSTASNEQLAQTQLPATQSILSRAMQQRMGSGGPNIAHTDAQQALVPLDGAQSLQKAFHSVHMDDNRLAPAPLFICKSVRSGRM
jgi:hypothetical protein